MGETTAKAWAFTDRHADLGYARYFASRDDLSEVDWSVMPRQYWAESDDMKERRQAEFLVFGVKSTAVSAKVQALLPGGAPPVVVQPDWYY